MRENRPFWAITQGSSSSRVSRVARQLGNCLSFFACSLFFFFHWHVSIHQFDHRAMLLLHQHYFRLLPTADQTRAVSVESSCHLISFSFFSPFFPANLQQTLNCHLHLRTGAVVVVVVVMATGQHCAQIRWVAGQSLSGAYFSFSFPLLASLNFSASHSKTANKKRRLK